MHTKRKVRWLLLVIVVCVALVGCDSNDEPTATIPPVETARPTLTPDPSLDLLAEVPATQRWNLVFIPKYLVNEDGTTSPYWTTAWDALQAAADEFGVTIERYPTRILCADDLAGCVREQIQLVDDAIMAGTVDGIIIGPLDSNRLVPVVEKAMEAGIPVVVIDTPVNTDNLLTYIQFSNYEAGKMLGQWVVEQLGGSGHVLVATGPESEQNAVDRRNGYLAGLQTGDIDILEVVDIGWDNDLAAATLTRWLTQYDDIDAIMFPNDDTAVSGGIAMIHEAGRGDMIITGFDANVGLAAIKAGDMDATIGQPIDRISRLAVQLLIRHLETGEMFPYIVDYPEIPLITADNVDEYMSD